MEKKIGHIGIDCGSVSIKSILMDENRKIIKSSYLRNIGLMETLKKSLEEILDRNYDIKGVGTTGSGRHFASCLIGADFVKSEILAHTIATLNYYPNVKTIMDIGGEDCKIMSIKNGVLESFIMNAVCGAGTGSVIDSIASRMGIKIEDVGELALRSKECLNFPGKCGVFVQSAVVTKLNSGEDKSDILMGVIRSLVNNYLMLGRNIELKPPYVYQGATSQNKAIVKALEESLQHEVVVPEYAPLMGAIGMALISSREKNGKTKFRAYDFVNGEYKTKSYEAKGCDNRCEIISIFEGDRCVGSLGNRCEKCVPKIK